MSYRLLNCSRVSHCIVTDTKDLFNLFPPVQCLRRRLGPRPMSASMKPGLKDPWLHLYYCQLSCNATWTVRCNQSESRMLVSDWLQLTGLGWVAAELTIS